MSGAEHNVMPVSRGLITGGTRGIGAATALRLAAAARLPASDGRQAATFAAGRIDTLAPIRITLSTCARANSERREMSTISTPSLGGMSSTLG